MTKNVVDKKEAKVVDVPADPETEICKVWSYVRYFYGQNEQLWSAVIQLQNDVNELRSQIKGGQ